MRPSSSDTPMLDPSRPSSLTEFIGREQECAALLELLANPDIRLITLSGPGGIGKTRLALEAMNRLEAFRPGQISVISLAPVSNPELVPAVIAQALELAPSPDTSALNAIHAAIGNRRLLMVLDNCEHLPSVGPLLVALLHAHPGLTILATSRSRLNLTGEHIIPLGALGVEDARDLFVQRAAAKHAERRIVETWSISTIDAICARLDGMPLAIELAAARAIALGPAALLKNLSQPLAMLDHGPSDMPLRHQTMRDTIAWSYALLDDAHRQGFRRLSVFVGGFTLEAAQAVLGDGIDALDLVDFLVSHSLVVPVTGESGSLRFTMLESIRQYGVEMLASSGEEEAIQLARADWLIQQAEHAVPHFDTPEYRPYAAAIRDELDNIRSALPWLVARQDGLRANRLSGAVAPIWSIGMMMWLSNRTWQDQWEDGVRMLKQTLALQEGVPSSVLIAPLAGIVWLLGEIGDPDETRTYAQALLARSIECADIGGAFAAHMRLASAAWKSNDLAEARAEFSAARDVWPPTANIALCGAALDRGRMELEIGDVAEAEAAFRTALEHGRRAETLSMLGRAASFLGLALREQGKLHEAVTHECAALDFFDRCGEVARTQDCIRFFAELALQLHRANDAVNLIAYAATIPKYHASRTIDDALLTPYRSALPEPAFSEAWEVGAQFTFAEARRVAEQIAAPIQQRGEKRTLQHPPLSPREVEVVRLLIAGKTNRAIAERLRISESTVEKHIHHAMLRLDLGSRTALVAWAVRNGISA